MSGCLFAISLRRLDLSANANHTSRLAAISRTRRVPALVHKGFSLSESSAIGESQARRYSQSKRGRLSSARRKAFCHSSFTAA